MSEVEEWRVAVSEVINDCPECGQKPEVFEETFYGIPGSKFQTRCSRCGRKTEYQIGIQKAIYEWNKGHAQKSRNAGKPLDNDALINLMGHVMAAAREDYIRLSSKEYPTGADKRRLADITEFIWKNPYMLPYDREYLIEELDREVKAKMAKKPRKKQAS